MPRKGSKHHLHSVGRKYLPGQSACEVCIPPAEAFYLSPDRQSIERAITLRSGRAARTRISLDVRDVADDSQQSLGDSFERAFLAEKVRPQIGNRKREVRVVDLFSGCGSMSLGIWEASRAVGARMVPVLALDFNETALQVYRDNFPGVSAVARPIETMLDRELGARASVAERQLCADVGEVEILIGGPPCQGHSNLNNHTRRQDPKNRLYDRMARFAELVRPTHVIIENVSAVLHDRGNVVDRTIAHLERIGYAVDASVVEAAAVGVPQRRRRHFVVASRQLVPNVAMVVKAFARSERSVNWAIGDLVGAPNDSILDWVGTPSPKNRERIDYLFSNRLFDLPDEMRPDCHRLNKHSYKSVYGRLRPDCPAQTITSGFVSMGQGRYVHPTRRRTITAHEAARLQFIPDFFNFGSVSKRTALAEMIGNAVPPKLTYVLGVELLR